ncbi:MAG: apolipoprotein N-acyltransferase [Gammaproteobacteria bacterium]|nr:MAG: apolipoprotein N-acyltransferase [Gammaproteobacteria bacterium]
MSFSLTRIFSGPARKRWVAFIAGSGLVLSFQPFALIWLAPLSLACLILLWEGTTPRQAGWIGYCYGLGLFTAGTYWLYISLNILGGLWPPIALFMMACLIAALAGYVALTGYLAVRIGPASGLTRWLIVIPAVWTLTEWLRGWLFTGFPWLSVGYSQVETPLGALAPLTGVYGVTWITLVCAGVVVCLVQGAYIARVIVFVLSALALMGLLNLQAIAWTQGNEPELQVLLVQGAVPQELKWAPQQLQPTLDLYQKLSNGAGEHDLIIWPEAAIPALPYEVPEFLQNLNEQMVSTDTQLFTGILTYDIELGEYKNTLWAMGAEEGKYFKRHLVAFGEYFPLPDFAKKIMRIMNLPSESIMSGADNQPLLLVKGVPVAATICYEIAFGAEQLQFFPKAQLMVNVSNDAWFGDSIAPHQHLQIGQMRALETGRYLLRVTNTGITAIVDPHGRVTERIPQFEPGVIDAVVQPYVGATPFVRVGNWPIIAGLFLVTAIAGLFRYFASGKKSA